MSTDRLREAARVLRERAESVLSMDNAPREQSVDHFVNFYKASAAGHDVTLARDNAYIATMHPGVGLALADWLDDVADHDASDLIPMVRGAFTLADLILGGA